MTNLPKDGHSQEIGRLAGRALGNKLPKSWIEKELDGDSDFGIDYFMQLKSSYNYVSFSFYLQLKGTKSPSYSSDKHYLSYDFKVKTLEYYHQQEPLVMVAVVDLKGNEDKLWKCPIYYFWLDDEWFYENRDKLINQITISVKIPTVQILDSKLDIYDFYSNRVKEKLKVSELKREIQPHSQDFVKSIGDLTKAISSKPVFLKATENLGDEPWLENPKGEIPTLLKNCSDSLNSNQLDVAQKQLEFLAEKTSDLTMHDLAEFYFQKAHYFSLHTDFIKANEYFDKAANHSNKDRYKLGLIESKFNLESVPDDKELQEIADSLTTNDYRNTITKCKCLALLGKVTDAIDILKSKFPERVVGQLIILTLSNNEEEIDQLIKSVDEDNLESDRDKYTFNSFAARRAYIKATPESFIYGKVLPVQGQTNFDVLSLKKGLAHAEKAWSYAKKIGYPSDIIILIDISTLIFGYFNKLEELFYHFDDILKQRPKSNDLIKYYCRLLFNEKQYEKTIKLLDRAVLELDGDDYGLLILSHHHLGKHRLALDILLEGESKILEDMPQNVALVFCLGAEMAESLMDEVLAKRFRLLVEEFDNGCAVLAISSFIRNVNNNPDNREYYCDQLYSEFVNLNKPVEIAEQLFSILNPNDEDQAERLCELSDCILSSHELFEKDYFRLAQAYITTNQVEAALALSEKHINKGIFDPYWNITQAICYQKLGRIGVAYDAIKKAIHENQFSLDHHQYYANLCLRLGLVDEVENALFDLLEASTEREQKLSILSNLISIFFSKIERKDKLIVAIRRFGKLVNQSDCQEEGQFLTFFMMSPLNEDEEEVKDFQARLNAYSKNFPDSSILKQGNIDLEGGSDSLIESIHKLTGITEEQITQWEQNKLKIRNGSLPVPFFMLQRFLSNTREIFTSWMLSLSKPEDHLEFKIKHAPQLDPQIFDSEMSAKKTVLIEDTTLLTLNEVKLLEAFLDEIGEFCLLDTSFENISHNSHPIAGTIYNKLAKNILDSINKHKSKMVLFPVGDSTPFDAYKKAIAKHNALLITDDMNLLQLSNIRNKQPIKSANSFNIVEFLHDQGILSEDEKFDLVSKISSLGLHVPNMTLQLLADTLAYHSKALGEVDYLETSFKVIFDKIFNERRDTAEAVDLFLRTILHAVHQSNLVLHAKAMNSLIRGLLIRHNYKDLESFIAFLFIYLCLTTPVKIESKLISTSPLHVKFWQFYQEMIFNYCESNSTTCDLAVNVVRQIFMLGEQSKTLAYNNIKSCFLPMTKESEEFEKVFQEFSIQHKLFNLRSNNESRTD
ncbi:MAG: DUF4365 domain-containing protein [Pseudoalteromonas sp.]